MLVRSYDMRKTTIIVLTGMLTVLFIMLFALACSCGDNIHPIDAVEGQRFPEGSQAPGGIERPPVDATEDATDDSPKAMCCRGLLESDRVPVECGIPPGQCRMFYCGGTSVAACNR